MIGLLIDQTVSSEALIRKTQLHPAQRAWEQGQPFGLVENGPHSPLVAALQNGSTRKIDGLINVYLRLRPYSPTMHGILTSLADSWVNGFGEYHETHWIQNPLMLTAMWCPSLASLVLLVFAADEVLDSHCDSFKDLLDISPSAKWKDSEGWAQDMVPFLQTLDLFLDKRLSSLAITFKDEELSEWLQNLSEKWIPASWQASVGDKRKIKGLVSLLRQHISNRSPPESVQGS
jgi:hypothetical protein